MDVMLVVALPLRPGVPRPQIFREGPSEEVGPVDDGHVAAGAQRELVRVEVLWRATLDELVSRRSSLDARRGNLSTGAPSRAVSTSKMDNVRAGIIHMARPLPSLVFLSRQGEVTRLARGWHEEH